MPQNDISSWPRPVDAETSIAFGGNNMATVVGLFDTRDDAQGAIEQIRAMGIDANKISVVMRSKEETQDFAEDTGVAGGAVTGAVGGGVLGGLAGLLVGIGALAIPGIGPVVAGGWLA